MRTLAIAALLSILILSACLPASSGEAVLATEVDPQGKPLNQSTVFTPDTPRILCSIKVAGMPAETRLSARWLYLNQNTWQTLKEETFSAGSSYYLVFGINSPLTGWPQGEYSLYLNRDGREMSHINFAVRAVDSVAPPVINNFAVTPETVILGQPVTLSWNVSGATRVVLNPAIGSISAGGSMTVNPAADTTYNLTALNNGGSSSSSIIVHVLPPPTGQPDLVITDIFRQSVMVYYTVRNQGTAASKGCNAQLYVGPNILGTDYIAPLAPGAQRTEVFGQYAWSYPMNTTATVCADTDGQNNEFNRENNCMTTILAGVRTL